MNSLLIVGTRIVVFALIAYSIAIITEQRKKIVTRLVLTFLTLGIVLDISATVFMIAGSQNSPFTLHGMLGYSSLTAMVVDTVLIWKCRLKNGLSCTVPFKLHLYSRLAYIWWVLAFITGALIVFFK